MIQMTAREAADRLNVSDVAVRKLVRSGRLAQCGTVGRTILIDSASVERLHQHGTRRGRAWSERTAWAALALLSGQDPHWLDSSERSRLKSRLRHLTSKEVYLLSRDKAKTNRYRATADALPSIQEHLIVTGGSAMRDTETAAVFGLSGGGGAVEGYSMSGDGESLAAALGMVEDPTGNVILHEVKTRHAFTEGKAPVAAIAVDLMGSLAIRERSAGTRVLQGLLSG